MTDERLKDQASTPSELSLLREALKRGEVLPLGTPKRDIEDIEKRVRALRPPAKGPRPTPPLVSERKRKRRDARDARKLNRV